MSHDRFERRYLPNGRVRHLFFAAGNHVTALCGVWTWGVAWFGTGSQEEYEKLERLPDCKRCNRRAIS